MRRILAGAMVVTVLGVALPATAQVSLDVKVGYSLPTGQAFQLRQMTEIWTGAFPIEIAARYRFTPNLSAGAYFQYAPALVASRTCGSGCSGYDMRAGVEAVWGFLPDGGMNPWVSVGTGWEWSRVTASGRLLGTSATFNGWEYFNVQAGLDFAVDKGFALGPYVGYFGGTYTGPVPSGSRAFHGWLQFGIKGTLEL